MSFKKFIEESIIAKIGFIAFLVILLLIPISMVSSLINEREQIRDKAVAEDSIRLGKEQLITGALLVVPYLGRKKEAKAYIRPESLVIESNVTAQKRSRGIYDLAAYTVDLKISGKFQNLTLQQVPEKVRAIYWQRASLLLAISDTRALDANSVITINGINKKLTVSGGMFIRGVKAQVIGASSTSVIQFSTELHLRGTSNLTFAPLGKSTTINVTSNWTSPGFVGRYSPEKIHIEANGFSASWKTSHFGSDLPNLFTDNTRFQQNDALSAIKNSSFGINFVNPVDHYQKSTRAIKYAVLFIFLTFVSFLMFEIFNNLRLHPIQYLMVGFAMCMFYLLFVSLSEHIPFLVAYFIASASVILLISGYCKKVLQKKSRAYTMAAELIALFGYLYMLLINQDYALLFGSIGLFSLLAGIMYATRNLDWYTMKFKVPPQWDAID